MCLPVKCGAGRNAEHVAVRGTGYHIVDRKRTGHPRLVDHQDFLPQTFAAFRGQHARQYVGGSSRRDSDHDTDASIGEIGLRQCAAWCERNQKGNQRNRWQKFHWNSFKF